MIYNVFATRHNYNLVNHKELEELYKALDVFYCTKTKCIKASSADEAKRIYSERYSYLVDDLDNEIPFHTMDGNIRYYCVDNKGKIIE